MTFDGGDQEFDADADALPIEPEPELEPRSEPIWRRFTRVHVAIAAVVALVAGFGIAAALASDDGDGTIAVGSVDGSTTTSSSTTETTVDAATTTVVAADGAATTTSPPTTRAPRPRSTTATVATPGTSPSTTTTAKPSTPAPRPSTPTSWRDRQWIGLDHAPTGYWIASLPDRKVHPRDGATFHGDVSNQPTASPLAAFSATASGNGYYLLAEDGGIYTFGDAPFYGSTGDVIMFGPAVDIQMTSEKGYIIVDRGGLVYKFGDAEHFGEVEEPSNDVFYVAAAYVGDGYWLLSESNGVIGFGSASAITSPGRAGVKAVDIEATATGAGYWVLYEDGVVQAFGDAAHHGNGVGSGETISRTPSGNGYRILGGDGSVTLRGS